MCSFYVSYVPMCLKLYTNEVPLFNIDGCFCVFWL